MFSVEDKFIIDIVKCEDKRKILKKYKSFKLDYEKILKILMDNKILLSKFSYIENLSNKNNLIYNQLMIDNKKFYKNILNILHLFDKYKLNIIVLKGLVLDYDAFEYNNYRIFSDIDLLVNDYNDIYKIIKVLEGNNYIVNYKNSFVPNIKREFILNIEKNNFTINLELKIGHKFIDSKFFYENKRIIKIDNIEIMAMSLDATLISQILYLYHYFYDFDSILLDNKLLLKYIVDFSEFLKHNIKMINFENIKLFFNTRKEILRKVVFDSSYYLSNNLFKEFATKLNFNINEFYIMNNKEISIFEKILNKNFYKYYLINYHRPNYKDKKILNLISKNIEVQFEFINDVIKIEICKVDNLIKLRIDNKNPYFYVLKLFYIDEYGENVYPYDCYSFRLFPQSFIVNRFIVIDDYIIEDKIRRLDGDIVNYYIEKNEIYIPLDDKIKNIYQDAEIFIDIDLYYVEANNHIIKIDNLKNRGSVIKFLVNYEP